MKLYILVDAEGVLLQWSKTRNMESEIEVEVTDDHPIFSHHFKFFKYIDGEILKIDEIVLNHAKAKKDAELNIKCENEILAGFLHTIDGVDYWFSYDDKAQTNFGDAKDALKDGIVPVVPWTVRLGGKDGKYTRIHIDLPTMQSLAISILLHKTGKISHYRDTLMPIVDACQTPDEVKAVVWE